MSMRSLSKAGPMFLTKKMVPMSPRMVPMSPRMKKSSKNLQRSVFFGDDPPKKIATS